jgi:hypothetical protein
MLANYVGKIPDEPGTKAFAKKIISKTLGQRLSKRGYYGHDSRDFAPLEGSPARIPTG